jgi:hypothetical protein
LHRQLRHEALLIYAAPLGIGEWAKAAGKEQQGLACRIRPQ